MKIWVVGAKGLLGSALVDSCLRNKIEVFGTAREEADVTDLDSLSAKAEQHKPTHIVNCAAFTDVDRAEKQSDLAFAINAQGAENVGHAAKQCGARLIHISTDYVFDGLGKRPYAEDDDCIPVNAYGKSKWEGEKRVLETMVDACIVRTSWLFGAKGKNFISSLMKWLREKEELQVASDQRGKPTFCGDLADALLALLDARGIVHFAGGTERSRFQMAIDLLNTCKEMGIKLKCRRIIPVSSTSFSTFAPRPSYSVLDTEKYFHLTQKKPRPWSEALKDYLNNETTT